MDDHKSTVSGTVSTEPPPSDLALLPPSVGFKEPQTNTHSPGQQLRQTRSKPTGNSFSASIREKAVTLLRPDRKIGPPPSLWKSIRSIILASCEFRVHVHIIVHSHVLGLNVLLLCIPVSVSRICTASFTSLISSVRIVGASLRYTGPVYYYLCLYVLV